MHYNFYMKQIKLKENDIRNIIKESLFKILNEVRYIPSYRDFHDKFKYDFADHNPIYNNERIRVFHGTDMKTAIKFAKNGIDGTQKANRRFSYETGMNPNGLFVTTSFDVATDFFGNGNSSDGYVVLEFTVNSNDLDTPVWNGQGTFFGQGSNPVPFRSKEERDTQKQQYNDKSKQRIEPHISHSDNPAMAERIFDNPEHQALFFGYLDPNQIKRFWVKRKDNDYKWQKYSFSQFMKKFGNIEFYYDRDRQGNEIYKPLKRQKLYRPNEDFISLEDMMEREMKMTVGKLYDKRKQNGTLQKEIERYVQEFKENMLNDNEMMAYFIKDYLYPKQAIQLLGKDRYNEIVGEVWR